MGVVGVLRITSSELFPVTGAGATGPRPVVSNCSVSPGIAGAVFAATRVPSTWMAIALPCAEKTAGENGPTGTVCGADSTPLLVTTKVTLPFEETSHGSCALICVGETKSNGAKTLLLKRTETLARDVGKGIWPASAIWGARLTPKIEMSAPGATGAVKLAALTMPPEFTTGV